MRILIIGGTSFVGRHIAQVALARGHELTLFNRGKTNPGLFPKAEHIRGNRDDGLVELEGRSFDAVVDPSGYFPRIVRMSADALKDRVGRYLFISTISVYGELKSGPDENAPVATIEDPTVEEITNGSYGPLKALCENEVRTVFGERASIARPGLIVGPNDPTGRFTYWPVRMARGGDVLVPDRKAQPVQVIDVRDLAEWCVHLLEGNIGGTFNATGPEKPYTLEDAFTRIRAAINPAARLVWADTALLEKHGVQPWGELPFVVAFDGSMDAMLGANVHAAVSKGLTFRKLEDTARDTLAWWREAGEPQLKAGLAPDKEAEVLSELGSRLEI